MSKETHTYEGSTLLQLNLREIEDMRNKQMAGVIVSFFGATCFLGLISGYLILNI